MIMQPLQPPPSLCKSKPGTQAPRAQRTCLGKILLISQVPATAAALASRSFPFAFQSPPRPPPKQQRQPLAPIPIIILGHYPGTTCAHNPWILLMLISHRPSCGPLDCSRLPPTIPTNYRHHNADGCHLQNVPSNNREATGDTRFRISCTSSLLHRVRILVTRLAGPRPRPVPSSASPAQSDNGG